jgi:hypothetical protein
MAIDDGSLEECPADADLGLELGRPIGYYIYRLNSQYAQTQAPEAVALR